VPQKDPPSPTPSQDEPEKDQDIAKAYDDDIAGAYEEDFTPPVHVSSEAVSQVVFECPQCGHNQDRGVECVKCGIIFDKFQQMADGEYPVEGETNQAIDTGETTPEQLEVKIEPAGFWIRVGAYFADGLVMSLVFIGIGAALFFLGGGIRSTKTLMALSPLTYAISFLVPLGYHIYFLGKRGYTPGKGFLGLQVIRQDGTGMSYGDAAIRNFSYLVSSIPLMLGFIWIAFDSKKHGWHDKIAKTQVIKAEEVPSWRKWITIIPAILIPLVGFVAALAIPVYSGFSSRAEVARAVSEMQTVKGHLEEYYYRYDRYPRTGEFPTFLISRVGQIPRDPFNKGRPYRYRSDGATFTLWSIGPDRRDNAAMIRYDPLLTRGANRQGDIVIRSDEPSGQNEGLFDMTPSSL
jgi:uncharacterized RDD family membrane protein YckC/type II secretory pathway pseudopilin PulG